MATNIKQIDDPVRRVTTLRVEGELTVPDAELILKIGKQIRAATDNEIVIDVADLDFMDSDSAPILREMAEVEEFEIQGIEIFLQTAINDAERSPA